jgi:hypothetical protein
MFIFPDFGVILVRHVDWIRFRFAKIFLIFLFNVILFCIRFKVIFKGYCQLVWCSFIF